MQIRLLFPPPFLFNNLDEAERRKLWTICSAVAPEFEMMDDGVKTNPRAFGTNSPQLGYDKRQRGRGNLMRDVTALRCELRMEV